MAQQNMLRSEKGFTLVEIIAVLVLLGILAAVAVPKYMNMTESAKSSAAQGQISEVKGRLNSALADYMLKNAGAKPTAAQLITQANTLVANACPTGTAVVEGDFTFVCAVSGADVTISVTQMNGQDLKNSAGAATPVVGTFKL